MRQFNGFPFDVNSKQFTKKRDKLLRWVPLCPVVPPEDEVRWGTCVMETVRGSSGGDSAERFCVPSTDFHSLTCCKHP